MESLAQITYDKNQLNLTKGNLKLNESEESKKQGTWTTTEQKKYIVFLQKYKKQLQNKQKRKNKKIFKEMAIFIGSRDGIQCRSHHMKLLRTHSKIRKIINHFKKVLNFYPKNQIVCKSQKSNSNEVSPLTPLNKKEEENGENEKELVQPLPIVDRYQISHWMATSCLGSDQANTNLIEFGQNQDQVFFHQNWQLYGQYPWVYLYNSLY